MNLSARVLIIVSVVLSSSSGIHGVDDPKAEYYYEEYEDDTPQNTTDYKLNVPESFRTYLEHLLTKETATEGNVKEEKVESSKKLKESRKGISRQNQQDVNQTHSSRNKGIENTLESLTNTLQKVGSNLNSSRSQIYHPYGTTNISHLLNTLGKGHSMSRLRKLNNKHSSSSTRNSNSHMHTAMNQDISQSAVSKEMPSSLSRQRFSSQTQHLTNISDTPNPKTSNKQVSTSMSSFKNQINNNNFNNSLAGSYHKGGLYANSLTKNTKESKIAEASTGGKVLHRTVPPTTLNQTVKDRTQGSVNVLENKYTNNKSVLNAAATNNGNFVQSTNSGKTKAENVLMSTRQNNTRGTRKEKVNSNELKQNRLEHSIRTDSESSYVAEPKLVSDTQMNTSKDTRNSLRNLVNTTNTNNENYKRDTQHKISKKGKKQFYHTRNINNTELNVKFKDESKSSNLKDRYENKTANHVTVSKISEIPQSVGSTSAKNTTINNNLNTTRTNNESRGSLLTSKMRENIKTESNSPFKSGIGYGSKETLQKTNAFATSQNSRIKSNIASVEQSDKTAYSDGVYLRPDNTTLNTSSNLTYDVPRILNNGVDPTTPNITKKHPIAELIDGLVKITSTKNIHTLKKRKRIIKPTTRVNKTTSSTNKIDIQNKGDATLASFNTQLNNADTNKTIVNLSGFTVTPKALLLDSGKTITIENGRGKHVTNNLKNTNNHRLSSNINIADYKNNHEEVTNKSRIQKSTQNDENRVENVTANANVYSKHNIDEQGSSSSDTKLRVQNINLAGTEQLKDTLKTRGSFNMSNTKQQNNAQFVVVNLGSAVEKNRMRPSVLINKGTSNDKSLGEVNTIVNVYKNKSTENSTSKNNGGKLKIINGSATSSSSNKITKNEKDKHPIQDLLSSFMKVTSTNKKKILKRRKKKRIIQRRRPINKPNDEGTLPKILLDKKNITEPNKTETKQTVDVLAKPTELRSSMAGNKLKQPLESPVSIDYLKNGKSNLTIVEGNSSVSGLSVKKREKSDKLVFNNIPPENKVDNTKPPSVSNNSSYVGSAQNTNTIAFRPSSSKTTVNYKQTPATVHSHLQEKINPNKTSEYKKYMKSTKRTMSKPSNLINFIKERKGKATLSKLEKLDVNKPKPVSTTAINKYNGLSVGSNGAASVSNAQSKLEEQAKRILTTNNNLKYEEVQKAGKQASHTTNSNILKSSNLIAPENPRNILPNNNTDTTIWKQYAQSTNGKGLESLLYQIYNILKLYIGEKNQTDHLKGSTTNTKDIESFRAITNSIHEALVKDKSSQDRTKSSSLSQEEQLKQKQRVNIADRQASGVQSISQNLASGVKTDFVTTNKLDQKTMSDLVHQTGVKHSFTKHINQLEKANTVSNVASKLQNVLQAGVQQNNSNNNLVKLETQLGQVNSSESKLSTSSAPKINVENKVKFVEKVSTGVQSNLDVNRSSGDLNTGGKSLSQSYKLPKTDTVQKVVTWSSNKDVKDTPSLENRGSSKSYTWKKKHNDIKQAQESNNYNQSASLSSETNQSTIAQQSVGIKASSRSQNNENRRSGVDNVSSYTIANSLKSNSSLGKSGFTQTTQFKPMLVGENSSQGQAQSSIQGETSRKHSLLNKNFTHDLIKNGRLHIIITPLDKKPNISVEISVENKNSSARKDPFLFQIKKFVDLGGTEVSGENKNFKNWNGLSSLSENSNIVQLRGLPSLNYLKRNAHNGYGHSHYPLIRPQVPGQHTRVNRRRDVDDKDSVARERRLEYNNGMVKEKRKHDSNISERFSLDVEHLNKVTNRKRICKKEEIVETNEKMRENKILGKSKTVQTIKTEVSSVDYVDAQ